MATNDPLLPSTPVPPSAEPNPFPPPMDTFVRSGETATAPERRRLGFGPARLSLAAAACALLVVVGSVGPWVTLNMGAGRGSVELGTVRGTTGDGQLTLALGLVAAVAMLLRARWPARWRWLAWAAPVPFVLAALAGGYDWWHLRRIAAVSFLKGMDFTTNVGWGLVVVTLGAAAGGILALAAAGKRPRARAARLEPVMAEEPPRPA
jgi:hypothetical protein